MGVVRMRGGDACVALVLLAARLPPLVVKIHWGKRGEQGSRLPLLKKEVTMQQGGPRGLQGALPGCGVSPPFSLTPPPEAAQGKGDLNHYARRNGEHREDDREPTT